MVSDLRLLRLVHLSQLLPVLVLPTILACALVALRSTEPFLRAVARAMRDPAVTEALGAPIRAGFPGGKYSWNGATGVARMRVRLRGAHGAGTVCYRAHRAEGQWQFELLRIDLDGGATVHVPPGDVPQMTESVRIEARRRLTVCAVLCFLSLAVLSAPSLWFR